MKGFGRRWKVSTRMGSVDAVSVDGGRKVGCSAVQCSEHGCRVALVEADDRRSAESNVALMMEPRTEGLTLWMRKRRRM